MVDGAQFTDVRRLIKAKYGMWVAVISAMNAVRGNFNPGETQSNAATIITLD